MLASLSLLQEYKLEESRPALVQNSALTTITAEMNELDHLAEANRALLILSWLTSDKLSEDQIEALGSRPDYKRLVRKLIINEPNKDSELKLLSLALNPSSNLGRFFWRGKILGLDTDLNHGNLKKLFAAFQTLLDPEQNPEIVETIVAIKADIKLVDVPVINQEGIIVTHDQTTKENMFANSEFFSMLYKRNQHISPQLLFTAIFSKIGKPSELEHVLLNKLFYLPRNKREFALLIVEEYFELLEYFLDNNMSAQTICAYAQAGVNACKKIGEAGCLDFSLDCYVSFLNLARKLKEKYCMIAGFDKPIYYYHDAYSNTGDIRRDASFMRGDINFHGVSYMLVGVTCGERTTKILFNLLITDRVPQDLITRECLYFKSFIIKHIANIPHLLERLNIINIALDPQTSLGRYFKTPFNFKIFKNKGSIYTLHNLKKETEHALSERVTQQVVATLEIAEQSASKVNDNFLTAMQANYFQPITESPAKKDSTDEHNANHVASSVVEMRDRTVVATAPREIELTSLTPPSPAMSALRSHSFIQSLQAQMDNSAIRSEDQSNAHQKRR